MAQPHSGNDSLSLYSDAYFMREALKQAKLAYEAGEVPIGCVVVAGGKRIVGRGYNQVEKLNDATAHAEMIALTAASQALGNKYLDECALYVTIEPCLMCAGALRWVQVAKIVYGAKEPKFGYSRLQGDILHPKTEIRGGILEEECAALMKSFFQQRRG